MHIYVYTCIHPLQCARSWSEYAYIRSQRHDHMRNIYIPIYTYIDTHKYTYYINTYVHSYINIYMYTYIYVFTSWSWQAAVVWCASWLLWFAGGYGNKKWRERRTSWRSSTLHGPMCRYDMSLLWPLLYSFTGLFCGSLFVRRTPWRGFVCRYAYKRIYYMIGIFGRWYVSFVDNTSLW